MPGGRRGQGCAASDYHQDYRDRTAAGAAVSIIVLGLTYVELMSSHLSGRRLTFLELKVWSILATKVQ